MNWYITSVPLQPRRPNWKAQMDTGMEANERTVGMGSGCWWSEEYKSLAYSFGTNRSWSYSSTRNEIWWAEEATYSALAVHQIRNRSHDHMKCINHTQSHLNSSPSMIFPARFCSVKWRAGWSSVKGELVSDADLWPFTIYAADTLVKADVLSWDSLAPTSVQRHWIWVEIQGVKIPIHSR